MSSMPLQKVQGEAVQASFLPVRRAGGWEIEACIRCAQLARSPGPYDTDLHGRPPLTTSTWLWLRVVKLDPNLPRGFKERYVTVEHSFSVFSWGVLRPS